MRIVIISDTHDRHWQFERLEGDVLIHCGDMFELGADTEDALADMDRWFGEQAFDLTLCTGGNHDLPLEAAVATRPQPFSNAIYLQDAAYEYGGLRFWGAPWVPQLSGHAFFADDVTLEHKWRLIPDDTDVLVTHTPPASIMDTSSYGQPFGCAELLPQVIDKAPKLHCFGHVHHSRGQLRRGQTLFTNASSIRSGESGILPPMVVDL